MLGTDDTLRSIRKPNLERALSANHADDPAQQFPADSPPGLGRGARRLLRHLKHAAGNVELLLPVVLRATPTGTSRRLTDETDLVIEGKPRSGNTFARRALEDASDHEISISSHVHAPAAVTKAVRLGYPTLVLIRQPADSVCSEKIAAPHASLESVLRAWIKFYERIWPFRDGFVVATFDQVTNDIGGVTDRVNARFATSFPRFEHSTENDERVFKVIEERHAVVHGGTENVVPRPSAARRAAKEELVARLARPEFKKDIARATALYRDYAALAEDPGR